MHGATLCAHQPKRLALPRSTAEGAKHPHLQDWSPPAVRGSAKTRVRRAHKDQEQALSLRKSKDVPQFAPNFSVYLLPPDAVCLYSEDRKFFLHGELYCAVAAAIGTGKSFGQIVRDLGKKFPSDKIHEALKRLVDRRYIVQKRRSSANT